MLAHITPVVLTYNEAPNIACLLDRLEWAREESRTIIDNGGRPYGS